MPTRLLIAALVLGATASAQMTWIVNAGGGPGVHFTDLPAAVAFAADGDTILMQTGPFNQGAEPFTTNKGLTIVGQGGQVPIATTSNTPIVIQNVPLASSFRMVGFDRLTDGALDIRIDHCQGQVHLERMRAREPGPFFPTMASIRVVQSGSVTMRAITNFGTPAIDVVLSNVLLVDCMLGVTHIGLGGGPAVTGTLATIDIVEPLFDAGPGAVASIATTLCQLTVTGDAAAAISNSGGDCINVQGGQLRIDPIVTLAAGTGFQPIVGPGPVSAMFLPASWTSGASPGQPFAVTTWAPPGMPVFLALGAPGALTPTALGLLGIDASQPYAFTVPFLSPPSGVSSTPISIPATLPIGSAFATQALVVTPGQLRLGLPCTFVLH